MSRNPLDFTGKVALVTGAASGMGLATAQAFAEAGAAVVLADFREDQAKAEAQKLCTAGHRVIAVRCDVSDDTQVEKMGRSHRSRVWPTRCRVQQRGTVQPIQSQDSRSRKTCVVGNTDISTQSPETSGLPMMRQNTEAKSHFSV